MISQTDGEERTVTFEYNVTNKLLRRIDHGGRTGTQGKYLYEDYKVEKYTYYPNGLAFTKLDRNGNTTTYTYDCHGRMISQVVGDESISYTYDNNGNTLTMKDSTGVTARAYDEMNRVVTKSVPNIGTTVFRYDIIYTNSDGKKYAGESSKDPKGNLTTKYYDSLGRLKLVASDQQASQFTAYEYDGNGNRISIKYPSGAIEQYTYYKNNQLATLVNKNTAGVVLESYSYTYDLANNQISKTDAKGVTEYAYDALNRLSTVKEPSGRSTEYKFDMAGNRINETVTFSGQKTTTLYEYNEQNRMISTTVEVNNQRDITKYSYDGNGNLTSKTREIFKKIDPANPPTPHFGMFIPGQAQGGVTEYAKDIASGICYYSYDRFNRMVKASPVGASAAEYSYNGEGLRVEKIADGKTTRYLYEYDKVVLEVDEKVRQTARNVHGLNAISRTVDGTISYYLYNGHADVTALIDEGGTIKGTYYYDAFGNIVETTGTLNNSITYAGYQYDKETGLYYLNSRMYDPKTARFMQEDSYRGDDMDPLSLNLYTYCHNEPIMYSDPTGHLRIAVGSADGSKGGKASNNKKGKSGSNNKNASKNKNKISSSSKDKVSKLLFGDRGGSSRNTIKVNKPTNTVVANKTKQGMNKQLITNNTIDNAVAKYKLNDIQIGALNLINEKYAEDKKIVNNSPDNPIIFAFEGTGSYSGYKDNENHPKGRYGAMMVVVKNHEISGVFKNTSTLPDDLDYKYKDNGSYNPIVNEGIYTFKAGLHKRGTKYNEKNKYPALNMMNYEGNSYTVPVTRNGKNSTSSGIDIHRADKMNTNSNAWRDSEGCQVIRKDEYNLFAATVGFAEYGKTSKNQKYYDVQGIYVVDRSFVK